VYYFKAILQIASDSDFLAKYHIIYFFKPLVFPTTGAHFIAAASLATKIGWTFSASVVVRIGIVSIQAPTTLIMCKDSILFALRAIPLGFSLALFARAIALLAVCIQVHEIALRAQTAFVGS